MAIYIAGSFVVLAGLWFWYSWRYQVLPQSAIYLLDDIPEPKKNERIIVFSPHPDDETIAAGGYIAAAAHNGAEVWMVLVTDGNRHGLEQKRYDEFRRSADILGVKRRNLFFLNYADGTLSKQNTTMLESRFSRIVAKIKPDIIIAPHKNDHHADHAIIGKAISNIATKKIVVYYYLVHHARFPLPRKFDPEFYLLPPIKMISFDQKWYRFMIARVNEDIKHEAVLQYKTQLRFPPLRNLLLGLIRRNELFVKDE
ncbi:PIG-L family deacetylase [Candidatus Microgenomates bacterium]|nr:PIG-L family deacetylase [Candidatus Microgenomates bacterium]